jgi:hypothetical protein
MKSLQARSFVAIPADMEALTRDSIQAARTGKTVRGTYLKVVVATAQAELDINVRKRAVKMPQPDEEAIRDQMRVMVAVHKRFYAIVLKVARENKPRNAKEMNKWTNFARTAKAKLKKWMLAGNDIRSLVPAKLTHADLEVSRPNRGWTRDRFQKRASAWAGHLVAAATAYAQEDRETAVATLETTVAQLTALLAEIGTAPRQSSAATIREHRPAKATKSNWSGGHRENGVTHGKRRAA